MLKTPETFMKSGNAGNMSKGMTGVLVPPDPHPPTPQPLSTHIYTSRAYILI